MLVDTNSFFDLDPAFLRDMNPDEEIGDYKTTQQTRLNAFRQETQDIKLTTEEGDTVTISSLSQFQASYLSFDYSAQLKDKSLSLEAEKLKMSSKNGFQISVDGDLNEEEKEDIAQVLGQLDEIMEDLVSGDLDEVMKGALGLIDDTDTITGLDAVLRFEQRVSMEQRTVTQLSGNGPLRPPHPPRGEHPSPDKNGGNNFFSGSSLAAKISGQLMEIIEQSAVEPQDLKGPVDKLFKGFLEKLSFDPHSPETNLKSQLVDQIRSDLDKQLQDKPAIVS